jgi:hypothetical protein
MGNKPINQAQSNKAFIERTEYNLYYLSRYCGLKDYSFNANNWLDEVESKLARFKESLCLGSHAFDTKLLDSVSSISSKRDGLLSFDEKINYTEKLSKDARWKEKVKEAISGATNDDRRLMEDYLDQPFIQKLQKIRDMYQSYSKDSRLESFFKEFSKLKEIQQFMKENEVRKWETVKMAILRYNSYLNSKFISIEDLLALNNSKPNAVEALEVLIISGIKKLFEGNKISDDPIPEFDKDIAQLERKINDMDHESRFGSLSISIDTFASIRWQFGYLNDVYARYNNPKISWKLEEIKKRFKAYFVLRKGDILGRDLNGSPIGTHYAIFGSHIDGLYEVIEKGKDGKGVKSNFLTEEDLVKNWSLLTNCRHEDTYDMAKFILEKSLDAGYCVSHSNCQHFATFCLTRHSAFSGSGQTALTAYIRVAGGAPIGLVWNGTKLLSHPFYKLFGGEMDMKQRAIKTFVPMTCDEEAVAKGSKIVVGFPLRLYSHDVYAHVLQISDRQFVESYLNNLS